MARDLKYGVVLTEKGGSLNGSDEPVFVLRAQDVMSGATLAEYRRQSESYGATDEHLAAVDDVILRFATWQDNHDVRTPD